MVDRSAAIRLIFVPFRAVDVTVACLIERAPQRLSRAARRKANKKNALEAPREQR